MEKKKLLMYVHYYIPDTASTGQILCELAEGMRDTFDITVICVVPSYLGTVEEKYKTKRLYEEYRNGVRVLRVRVPEFSKSDKKSRIKNIVAYFFGALAATFRAGKQDYVFAVSQPPVLGGLLGVWGKWVNRAAYIYNIQDFNPEQILAVRYSGNRLITDVMMLLDKFSCRQSNLLITVGRDLVKTVEARFGGKNVPRTIMINNWINEKEIYPLPEGHPEVVAFRREYGLEGKFVVMYSGNIGLSYDLENLIKVLKQFRKGYTTDGKREEGPRTADGREVVFAFAGAGSVLDKLVAYSKKHRFENIVFIPYQAKEKLNYSLNAGDVHWCVSAKGIKGVSCPSKAYGIMAAGKAVLGVLEEGTEIRELIERSGCGRCCEPGDYDAAAEILDWFISAGRDEIRKMGRKGREYLEKNLPMEASIRKYTEAIKGLERKTSQKGWERSQ